MFHALAMDTNGMDTSGSACDVGHWGGDTERGNEGLRVEHGVLGRRRGRGQQNILVIVETPPSVTIAEAKILGRWRSAKPAYQKWIKPNLSTSHPSMPTVMA